MYWTICRIASAGRGERRSPSNPSSTGGFAFGRGFLSGIGGFSPLTLAATGVGISFDGRKILGGNGSKPTSGLFRLQIGAGANQGEADITSRALAFGNVYTWEALKIPCARVGTEAPALPALGRITRAAFPGRACLPFVPRLGPRSTHEKRGALACSNDLLLAGAPQLYPLGSKNHSKRPDFSLEFSPLLQA